MEIVESGEGRQLAVAEAMVAMMMQGQLTIAAFDRGTAALEEVGTLTGDLFDALALGRREGLERVIGLAQRFEEVVTQRSQAVAVLGAGMARGDAFEVQGGNELLNEGGLQVGRQREGLDLEVQGREEKGDGRQPLGGQACALARRSRALAARSAASATW